MPSPTPEMVRPLIKEEQVEANRLLVSFKCPVTSTEVGSWATLGQRPPSADPSPKGLWGAVRKRLSGLIGGRVGGGASPAQPQGPPPGGWTEADHDQGRLDAFRRVSVNFEWDPTDKRYVSSELMEDLQTEFWHMMKGVSFDVPRDREILARILTEVAIADDVIKDEEREFFEAFTGTNAASIDELAKQRKLTKEELTDTTPAYREAMLVLAYALAFTDSDFDESEQTRLHEFEQGLAVPRARAVDLQRIAREFAVDQLLEVVYDDHVMSGDEQRRAMGLAMGIGVDRDTLKRLDDRIRKRKGIS